MRCEEIIYNVQLNARAPTSYNACVIFRSTIRKHLDAGEETRCAADKTLVYINSCKLLLFHQVNLPWCDVHAHGALSVVQKHDNGAFVIEI